MLCFLGSQIKPVNPSGNASSETKASAEVPKQPTRIVDINETQTCQNKGCGKPFKEKDNHDTACSYHPGPPVFHDRVKGVGIEYFCCILYLFI